MTVSVEIYNTGDPELQSDMVAMVEHVLSNRRGYWRVLIVGFTGKRPLENEYVRPNSFERSYALQGSAGEHEPQELHILQKLAF
jgi:hypothetical protein